MKRAFVAISWALVFSGTVTAAPMVYTFSGVIYSINDAAGAVDSLELPEAELSGRVPPGQHCRHTALYAAGFGRSGPSSSKCV